MPLRGAPVSTHNTSTTFGPARGRRDRDPPVGATRLRLRPASPSPPDHWHAEGPTCMPGRCCPPDWKSSPPAPTVPAAAPQLLAAPPAPRRYLKATDPLAPILQAYFPSGWQRQTAHTRRSYATPSSCCALRPAALGTPLRLDLTDVTPRWVGASRRLETGAATAPRPQQRLARPLAVRLRGRCAARTPAPSPGPGDPPETHDPPSRFLTHDEVEALCPARDRAPTPPSDHLLLPSRSKPAARVRAHRPHARRHLGPARTFLRARAKGTLHAADPPDSAGGPGWLTDRARADRKVSRTGPWPLSPTLSRLLPSTSRPPGPMPTLRTKRLEPRCDNGRENLPRCVTPDDRAGLGQPDQPTQVDLHSDLAMRKGLARTPPDSRLLYTTRPPATRLPESRISRASHRPHPASCRPPT